MTLKLHVYIRDILLALWGFFPFQLLLAHLKKNLLLLFFWILIFGFTLGFIGKNYGISNLILAPEYLGKVNYLSFAILGWAFGGFVVAFQLNSYMINSIRFPFIATFSRPFAKYSLNNSFFPFLYLIVFFIQSVRYQQVQEYISTGQSILNVLCFYAGYGIHWAVALGYFLTTNVSISKIEKKKEKVRTRFSPVNLGIGSRQGWLLHNFYQRSRYVKTYLTLNLKIMHARDIKHYNPDVLEKILRQNRVNASIYELFVLFSFILIGYYADDYRVLTFPAGATIFLFFTVLTLLSGIVYSWIRGWNTIALLGLFILIVWFSRMGWIVYESKIFGISYDKRVPYGETHFQIYANEAVLLKDKESTIKTLNKWKKHNSSAPEEKPVIVFINCNGGGLRSSLWTHRVLRMLDSLTRGDILKKTFLITGSSGGMIGASLYRELYLLSKLGLIENRTSQKYEQYAAADLLNPILINLTTNDWFIRLKRVRIANRSYFKDRGYAFENQLLINSNYLLNKRIGDYKKYEEEALIPWILYAPVIVEDGKQLIISSQSVSYLCAAFPFGQKNFSFYNESVEFSKLFGEHARDSLFLTSAIRMSASFPLIMPSVDLPTYPKISINDAGLRDNFGLNTSLKFIASFKNWFEVNTSRIILINIRDIERSELYEYSEKSNLLQSVFMPINSLYDNLFLIQDYNNLQMLRYLKQAFSIPIELITFDIKARKGEISMSFHLTKDEKQRVIGSFNDSKNMQSLHTLLQMLGEK